MTHPYATSKCIHFDFKEARKHTRTTGHSSVINTPYENDVLGNTSILPTLGKIHMIKQKSINSDSSRVTRVGIHSDFDTSTETQSETRFLDIVLTDGDNMINVDSVVLTNPDITDDSKWVVVTPNINSFAVNKNGFFPVKVHVKVSSNGDKLKLKIHSA